MEIDYDLDEPEKESLPDKLGRLSDSALTAADKKLPFLVEHLRKEIYETAYQAYVQAENELERTECNSEITRKIRAELRAKIGFLEDWMRDYEPLGCITKDLQKKLDQAA